MTFDKDAKTIHWGKKLFFQQVVQGQLNIHRQSWVPALNHMQKKKKFLISKWIKDLHLREKVQKISKKA